MTVHHLNASNHVARTVSRHSGDEPNQFSRHRVGQQLRVSVLRRLDADRYLVSFEGAQHIVDSDVQLDPDSQIRVTVMSVGDTLQLKYHDTRVSTAAEDSAASDPTAASGLSGFLAHLAKQYRVAPNAFEHKIVRDQIGAAAQPVSMALGALYLAKLGLPVDESTLPALYAAQTGAQFNSGKVESLAVDITALMTQALRGDEASHQELTKLLQNSVNSESAADPQTQIIVPEDGQRPTLDTSDRQHETARRLLNVQNDGSLAYSYGSLPLLVANQLIELQLVVLRSRNDVTPIRRLVMTLQTESFGKLRVVAQALDQRLVLTFTGESSGSADALAQYKQEVHDLIARLGWNLEAVGYETNADPGNAASAIVSHVLNAGTVDRLL
jgi:hypothetical protein